jgi:hypothetical protein
VTGDALDLPFDQYQRYRLVSDLLGALRGRGPALSVLDVGGRTALLRKFLTTERITLVDLEASDEPGLVLGSGAALPFADGAFDVVCAFDTLEHVPKRQRRTFVGECRRVCKHWVVLAGPYQASHVQEAERLLVRFLADKLDVRHRYLEEHRARGLPSRPQTERLLKSLGGEVTSIGHANLERWLAMMCLSLYLDHDPALRGLAASVHRFYNRSLYASDHAEPVYRHLVIAAFDGASAPDMAGLLQPPLAPRGALEPFTELTGELVAFDRERAAWREKEAELTQVTRDLESDLDAHKQTLASMRAEAKGLEADLDRARREGSEAIAALERELSAGRARIGNLEEQAADLRAEYERELREHAEVAAALRANLEEDGRTLGALRAELERDRAEHSRERETLTADLDQHARALAELGGELALLRSHTGELEGALESERSQARESIAAMQADLRGHKGQLADLRREGELLRVSMESERDQHAKVAAALEADLDGHKRELAAQRGTVSDMEAEITMLRQELERERRESAEVAGALQESLDAHQQVLAQERTQLAGHEQHARDLSAELELTRAAAREIEAALQAANASARGLDETLEHREQELQAARALLRSRLHGLKRAFGPKRDS